MAQPQHISSLDQSSDDPGASLPAPDLDDDQDDDTTPTDRPESTPGQGSAPKQASGRPGANGGTGKPSNRKDRREAFGDMRKKLQEELMTGVKAELGQFQQRFTQILESRQPQQQQPQGQQQPDPFESRLTEIDQARAAEMKLMTAHDRTKGPYDFTRYQQLDQARTSLLARKEAFGLLREMGLTPQMIQQMKNGGQQRPYGREQQLTARFTQLQTEFDQLSDNDWGKVGAYRRYLVQGMGRPDSIATDREAAAHVAAELGKGGGPAPRGRAGLYQSPGAGERGNSRQQKEMRLPVAAIKGLSPDEQAMASRMIFAEE